MPEVRASKSTSFASALARLHKLLPGEILLDAGVLEKYAGDKWFATHRPDAVAASRSRWSA